MDRSSQTFLNPSRCNRKYRQVVQVYLVMFAILPQVAMVNMQMFVSSPDLTTPHGGAPFQGWRKGRWPCRALGPWGSHVVLETQDGHMDQVPGWSRCIHRSATGFGFGHSAGPGGYVGTSVVLTNHQILTLLTYQAKCPTKSLCAKLSYTHVAGAKQ